MTSLAFLDYIRAAEFETIVAHLPGEGRLLEIGAGTGQQALALSNLGFEVTAIDLASSNYTADRVFPIVDYNGRTIPFPDASFDIVFSSNVLEHVHDLPGLCREMARVLRPGGVMAHVIPTHSWRLWANLAAYPAATRSILAARTRTDLLRGSRRLARAVLQVRHGERGNAWSELWYFRPAWWRARFRDFGLRIVRDVAVGILYSPEELFGLGLSINARRRWSRLFGSSTHLFMLSTADEATEGRPGR